MVTCADCRFYQKPADGMGPDGCCYRYPPRVVALMDPEFVGDLRQHSPFVSAISWCGEHQPAKPDAAASLSLMADALAPFLAVANAAMVQTGEVLITTDLADDEGDPLNLSSWDFVRLADAWVKATSA